MKSFMTSSVFTCGAFLDWLMMFCVSKVVTIYGLIGIKINMNLNVNIDIVCVVTDISDRHVTLIFCIQYVITQEITI